jgi:hypothetical protein
LKLIAEGINLSDVSTVIERQHPVGFRVRLQFKIATLLQDPRQSLEVIIDGRPVEVASARGRKPLQESPWVAMTASGFDTPESAFAFGQRLKLTVQLIAARNRIGVDCGAERPLGTIGTIYRDEIFKHSGVWMRGSIHGLDIFEDRENVRFISGEGTIQTLVNPTAFFDEVQKYHLNVDALTPVARDIVLLLNFALMTTEPVAQAVFAISAVEMIGQQDDWNKSQLAAIERLALHVKEDKTISSEEADEISDAIKRSLHKLSLRQGVLRLLKRLGLSGLKKDWDSLYGERCELVHGLAPEPGKSYSGLANRAINLCGYILLTALGKEVAGIDDGIMSRYPVGGV